MQLFAAVISIIKMQLQTPINEHALMEKGCFSRC